MITFCVITFRVQVRIPYYILCEKLLHFVSKVITFCGVTASVRPAVNSLKMFFLSFCCCKIKTESATFK